MAGAVLRRSSGRRAFTFLTDCSKVMARHGEALVQTWRVGLARSIVTVDCGAMAHEALAMAQRCWRRCDRGRSPQMRVTSARGGAGQSQPAGRGRRFGGAHGHLAAVGVAFLACHRDRPYVCANGAFLIAQRAGPDGACSIWWPWEQSRCRRAARAQPRLCRARPQNSGAPRAHWHGSIDRCKPP